MNNFAQALMNKIEALQDERDELEDALSRANTKLEALEELLSEEEDRPPVRGEPKAKRKRGRPKGSKKKVADKETSAEDEALYAEAVATLPEEGTTPEMQEKLVNRYRPIPRATDSGPGPGITTGTLKDIKDKRRSNATPKSDKTISIEDD